MAAQRTGGLARIRRAFSEQTKLWGTAGVRRAASGAADD